MKKLLVLLLLIVGCSQSPSPTPLVQIPPFVVPIPVPTTPTPPPVQTTLYGNVSFTTTMSPHWYNDKRSSNSYYLEWQNPDGSWRPALIYLDIIGVGWTGWMTEAQPTITQRLPVGNYHVVYGLRKGVFAYYHNEPWEQRFTLTPNGEVNLSSTFVWE